jgi:solute carrier family 25 carnitine/acylcarnitine transporter 20/29
LGAFIAGGISGSSSWLFTYPIDYVKTVVQSQQIENIRYKSAIDCAMKVYQKYGVKTFFTGLGVTMLRSFPVNGMGFFAFEGMIRLTGRKKDI